MKSYQKWLSPPLLCSQKGNAAPMLWLDSKHTIMAGEAQIMSRRAKIKCVV